MPASTSNSTPTPGVNTTRLAALQLLCAMGWKYVTPQACLARRGGSRGLLLEDSLLEFLRARRFSFQDQSCALSNTALASVLASLKALQNWPGDNHRLYAMLKDGVDVMELIPNQQAQSISVPLIDWQNQRANLFEVTQQLALPGQPGEFDIVCFINGIPVCAMLASDVAASVLVRQHCQWQGMEPGRVPSLYLFAQVLLALGGEDGRYASILSGEKFWTRWNEEEMPLASLQRLRRTPLPAETATALLADLAPAQRQAVRSQWSVQEATDAPVFTPAEQLLCGLLLPERLLAYLDWAVAREQRSSKRVARSHQFFAVRALLARLSQHLPGASAKELGARAGGVVWHTTGSGKSLTMIFLLQALQRDPVLRECRVIVVTDRLDLQDQLASSFLKHGVFAADKTYGLGRDTTLRAQSGKELAQMIGSNRSTLMFTLLHKFNGALMQEVCRNPSDKIIVLVDEAHRSHGGELHARMRRVLKRAAFVAFTGTPLLKHEKTRLQFGPILHRYTMQRALAEQMITPLLYEERQAQLVLDPERLQHWFAHAGLNAAQQAHSLRALARKPLLQSALARIEMIAWDIALHFNTTIKQTGAGLKGLVAASSKQDAVRYHYYLQQTGLVSSAVLISPPEPDDDAVPPDVAGPPTVSAWWQAHVGKQRASYEARCLKQYAEPGQLDLLIVVDRLLTGFDQPRAGVLYLDKSLQQHGLLQAIARVNRLHEAKRFGLLVDYRQNLRPLDTALQAYQALAQVHAQAQVQAQLDDYEPEDLADLYQAQAQQVARVPQLLRQLEQCFPPEAGDVLAQYRQALWPQHVSGAGARIDLRQGLRETFFSVLGEFAACLRLAWVAQTQLAVAENAAGSPLLHYQQRLEFFIELAQLVRHDLEKQFDPASPILLTGPGSSNVPHDGQPAGFIGLDMGEAPAAAGIGTDLPQAADSLVYRMRTGAERQAAWLRDHAVQALEVRQMRSQYVLPAGGSVPLPEHWSAEQIRSELDMLRTRITKRIDVDLDDDPYAQQELGRRLQQSLADLNAAQPLARYRTLQQLEHSVLQRQVPGVPQVLAGQRLASACYGVFLLQLGESALEQMSAEQQSSLLQLAQWVQQEAKSLHLAAADVERNVSQHLNKHLFLLVGATRAVAITRRIVQLLASHLRLIS